MQQINKVDQYLKHLDSTLIVSHSDLHCPSGKKVISMCINPQCNSSLFCSNQKCKLCSGKHQKCTTVQLSHIAKQLNQWTNKHKDFITKMLQIDNLLVEMLKKNQEEYILKYMETQLNLHSRQIIERIFRSKEGNISGAEGRFVHEQIQVLNQKGDKRKANEQLAEYRANMERWIPAILSLKENIAPKPSSERITIENKITPKKYSIIRKIDSFILDNSTEELKDQLQFLWKELNNPKQLQLLFRASQHYFRAKSFHKNCDNLPDTLILVRTEFGKTVAGFTHYKWNQVDGSLKDEDKKAFLLQLDLRQKYLPNSQTSLIFCSNGYGPTFGAGRDLYIADKCNSNNSSYAFFPSTYNNQEPNQYYNGQQSYKAFSGAINDKYFRVLEYEVFQVVYRQEDIKIPENQGQEGSIEVKQEEQKKDDTCSVQ